MNKHSIDRLFKKKLSGHELPYPEHLWSSIDQKINDLPQDKRRGGLWVSWLGLGLFLLLAGSLGYFWMNSGNTTLIENGTEQLGVNESVAQKSTHAMQEKVDLKMNESVEVTSATATTSDLTVNSENLTAAESGITNKKASATQNDFDAELILQSQSTNRETISGSKSTPSSTSQSSSKDAIVTQNSILGEMMESQAGESMVNSNSKESLDSDLRSSHNTNIVQPCEPYKNERSIESYDDAEQRKIADAVADLGGFGKKRFIGRWSLGLIYAPDWHFRTMEVNGPGGEALLNQRDRTETFANAFTTGFEVRLKMRQWSVHTGLHYAQINERNKYIIDGTEQLVNGVLVPGDLTRTVINRQQMLQLPILLGYEVSRGPWALEINAGASLGLRSWSSGEVFNPSTLTYARYESDTNNTPYSNQGRHSWQAGASLSYKVGYDYQWFVRPYYRSYFDSFTKPEYELNQNYDNIGVTVGCRYLL